MRKRLVEARLNFQAELKVRLVDIATGAAGLQPEHRAWLDVAVLKLKLREHYWIDIVGYASKLRKRGARGEEQSLEYNRELSYQRASEVAFYLGQLQPSVQEHIRIFTGRGNVDYVAPATDNSPDERGVEVHVSFAVQKPVPPADLVEVDTALPGGRRCAKWAVASPGGATVTIMLGATIAVNFIAFRCCEGKGATHLYWSPGGGAGASWCGPAQTTTLRKILQNIIGSPSYSGMSFTEANAITPFNFHDLEHASARFSQASIGFGGGYQQAYVSVSGPVFYRNQQGHVVKATMPFLSNVNVSGKDLQVGVGAAIVGGPLFKVN